MKILGNFDLQDEEKSIKKSREKQKHTNIVLRKERSFEGEGTCRDFIYTSPIHTVGGIYIDYLDKILKRKYLELSTIEKNQV